MDKIERVRKLLKDIGMPKRQQADLCVLTILGMANLKKTTKWSMATNEWLRIHDIIAFANQNYDVKYAENSRETFRKQALHHFRTAAIVEDNGKATNSPDYRYRLTAEFVEILRKITRSGEPLKAFKKNHQSLMEIYASKKEMEKMPVGINSEITVFYYLEMVFLLCIENMGFIDFVHSQLFLFFNAYDIIRIATPTQSIFISINT